MAKSLVGRHFRLEYSGHRRERKGTRFLTELRAGTSTFFAMAYIISVNATVVAGESSAVSVSLAILTKDIASGATCVCGPTNNDWTTRDPFCMSDANPSYISYMSCTQEIKREIVTATAATAALTTFAMGLFANMPVALAPGMGLNAYFTYQVVGVNGSGSISYELALTAVFVEGLIFVLLSFLGLRQWLARCIPLSLKIASGTGIGLYLALNGLTYTAGIGAITGGGNDTPLTLAGCVPKARDDITGMCKWGHMQNPTMYLGILGGIVTSFCMMYRLKGAIIFGILLVSFISWPRNTPVTFFSDDAHGNEAYEFFKKVVTVHPISKVFIAQDWDITSHNGGQFAIALATFLYVDILDCTGTLYSMARFCGAMDEETQDFEGSAAAYTIDALGISLGSLVGCPPVTAFIESGAGISAGGATGLTSCTTGICFLFSIFFAPIFASIPQWATGCTLILVGAMMTRSCTEINWRYIGDSIPAFLTMIIMPFTFSIAYGLIVGIIAYTILNSGAWIINKLSSGRIVPNDYEQKDYWTYKVKGGLLPPWVRRLLSGKRDFWRDWDESEELTSRDSFGGGVKGKGVVLPGVRGSVRTGRGSSSMDSQGHVVRLENISGGLTGDRSWEIMIKNQGYPRYGPRIDEGEVETDFDDDNGRGTPPSPMSRRR